MDVNDGTLYMTLDELDDCLTDSSILSFKPPIYGGVDWSVPHTLHVTHNSQTILRSSIVTFNNALTFVLFTEYVWLPRNCSTPDGAYGTMDVQEEIIVNILREAKRNGQD